MPIPAPHPDPSDITALASADQPNLTTRALPSVLEHPRGAWHDLLVTRMPGEGIQPTVEEYLTRIQPAQRAAAQRAYGQQDLSATPAPVCFSCGSAAVGDCVVCDLVACEDHSHACADDQLRCLPHAADFKAGREPTRAEAAAARDERDRLTQMSQAAHEMSVQLAQQAETERRQALPALRGQALVDYLSGRADEFDHGQVTEMSGADLAAALKLADVPSQRIGLSRDVGALIKRTKHYAEQGWLVGSTPNTLDPDSRDSNGSTHYLFTDGRGASVGYWAKVTNRPPTARYSAEQVRALRHR